MHSETGNKNNNSGGEGTVITREDCEPGREIIRDHNITRTAGTRKGTEAAVMVEDDNARKKNNIMTVRRAYITLTLEKRKGGQREGEREGKKLKRDLKKQNKNK